jgi:large subunit ribosomal protein L13
MTHNIDATGKIMGRVASEAAKVLMGKNTPAYERHLAGGNKVKITNASKARISPKKLKETMHETYSGYPGGLKLTSAEMLSKKKGFSELFRLAVYGMLPPNKLRNERMKNLSVSE